MTTADLERLARETPGLVAALAAVVDRVEARGGRLPARITVAATAEVEDALRRVFSARIVRRAAEGHVRLELGALLRDAGSDTEATLVRTLYALTRREPRDPAAEARSARHALERALVELQARAESAAARAFVAGELAKLATGAPSERLASDVVRAIDAVVRHRDAGAEPVRAQTFAARALGSSKALRPGTELHRRVTEALLDHDVPTLRMMDDAGVALTPASAHLFALAVNGVVHDEAAASVLCFGPIVYGKRRRASEEGVRFDHVARHAALGESSRLVLQQLRDTDVEQPAARRVTIFENLAPYLDYVDACVEAGRGDEIVVCSGGQANLAVVALVRRLAAHDIAIRHAGDLDRSGVLILRSLAKRTGAPIAPLLMDASTHARFAARGQAIARDELARLDALLAGDPPDAPCHDLLRVLRATGTWIEQEAFFEDVCSAVLAS